MHNLSCEKEFYLHENEKSLPYQRAQGCALNLVLIQRPGETRKWLFAERVHLTRPQSSLSLLLIDEYENEIFLYRVAHAREPTASFWGRRGSKEVSRTHLRLSVYWTTIGENSYKTKTPTTQMKSEKDLASVALALLMYAFVSVNWQNKLEDHYTFLGNCPPSPSLSHH